jgi:hypothetical protein
MVTKSPTMFELGYADALKGINHMTQYDPTFIKGALTISKPLASYAEGYAKGVADAERANKVLTAGQKAPQPCRFWRCQAHSS